MVKTIAFRRVQIVETPLVDQQGLSWYFMINNIPVFMGGLQGRYYVTQPGTHSYNYRIKLDPSRQLPNKARTHVLIPLMF